MVRHRDVVERIGGLNEISQILGAMKALALAEIHRIAGFIETQRSALDVVEAALADFLAFHPPREPTRPARDVVCVIGSERGFCGDFNLRLIEAGASASEARQIVVGSRLAQQWSAHHAEPLAAIDGASVVEEVPAVLDILLERVGGLVTNARDGAAPGLVVTYHGRGGIESRRLLPVPEPPAPRRALAYPPQLLLAPPRVFRALADEYLSALLHEVYYDSLLAENQQRLEHMERALRKLDERLETLGRLKNQLRQEAIIEDIEVILLATLA